MGWLVQLIARSRTWGAPGRGGARGCRVSVWVEVATRTTAARTATWHHAAGPGTARVCTPYLPSRAQQYAKDLEQERRAAAAAARKADELQQAADSLAAQNAELLLSNTSLSEASTRLEDEKNALVLANRRLTEQVPRGGWARRRPHAGPAPFQAAGVTRVPAATSAPCSVGVCACPMPPRAAAALRSSRALGRCTAARAPPMLGPRWSS